MKVTFLGTGAGEGYPGFWCNCPNCAYARERKGPNLRTNTATLIDSDTMLDLNDGCFLTAARLGIPMGDVKRLLITHAHEDHLSGQMLWWRFGSPELIAMPPERQRTYSSPRFTDVPRMDVFLNQSALHALMRVRPDMFDEYSTHGYDFRLVRDGCTYESGDMRVTAVRSQHGAPGFCHSYIVERGDRALLYATDTGGYDEDMLALILSRKYDLVVMEGTFGLGADSPSHMNLNKNRQMKRLLDENQCWKGAPCLYLTHMSPHWTPPHDLYSEMLAPEGICVAYDGLTIEV